MRQFRDVKPLIDEPGALRDHFLREGIGLMRGLLDPIAVGKVRDEVVAQLGAAGWLDAAEPPARARPGRPPVNEDDTGYYPVYTNLQRLQSFHELAHDPALVGLAAELLGTADVLVHPRKIARITFPGNDFGTTRPHQDFRLIQGTLDVLTMWIPLGDCPAAVGGLRGIPGSHRWGLLPVKPVHAVGKVAVDVDDDHPDWSITDFATGDVLVFHSLTVHGARPNVSDRIRLSADFRYQAREDDVVAESLHPHHHPAVPDWPELTVGWTDDRAVRASAAVTTVAFQRPDEIEMPAASRFL